MFLKWLEGGVLEIFEFRTRESQEYYMNLTMYYNWSSEVYNTNRIVDSKDSPCEVSEAGAVFKCPTVSGI